MSQTFEPTPEQLAALTHRFTRMPRGISRVFTGFGVVCGGLLLAVALVSPTVVLGPDTQPFDLLQGETALPGQ